MAEEHPITPGPTADSTPFVTMTPFRFTGTGGEYFGIWFANIFFTIITLGIYSAWAKVRNLRYFYRNTSLAGATFDYHADPVAILKGRMLAVLLFILYSVVSDLNPAAALTSSVLLVIALPWIIVRALKFRFANTSYRNVRFGFDGSYRGALKEFILIPILILPTFGLIWPYTRYRQNRYIVEHVSYGTTRVRFAGSWLPWLKAGLPLVLIAVFGIAIPGIYAAVRMSMSVTTGEPTEEFPEGEPVFDPDALGSGFDLAMSVLPLAMLAFYVALPYWIVTSRNLLFGAAVVGPHGFESSMRTLKYIALLIGCFVIVAFTFGFGTPFAKVILANYKADTLELAAHGDLGAFVTREAEQVRAFGEEIGEAFDIDIGL